MHAHRLFLLLVMLCLRTAASAAVIAIGFNNTSLDDSAGVSGYFWNGFNNNLSPGGALLDVNGDPTGITMTTQNAGGFLGFGRGELVDAVVNGHTVPAVITDNYLADNDDSGRNGEIVLRFASSEQFSFTFNILTSYDHNNPNTTQNIGAFNVGGTYTLNSGYTGGTTVLLNAAPEGTSSPGTSNWSGGVLDGGVANDVIGSTFYIDLKVGATHGSGAAYLNALVIETLATGRAIPEPSTFGLLAMSVALLRRRLRR